MAVRQYLVAVDKTIDPVTAQVVEVSAKCPFCGIVNVARLQGGDIDQEDRQLEWWPGATSGVWCSHSCGFRDEFGMFVLENVQDMAVTIQEKRDLEDL